jgi:hypothetical protein
MSHPKSSHRAGGLYRCIAIATACAFAAPVHAEITEAIPAIWRVQQLEFKYHSARSHYSCGDLEKKIQAILLAVGVHDSVVIKSRCGAVVPVGYARVSISLAAPVEATEENIRAAISFEPHELLAAHLRQVTLPTAAADVERFAASWRRISLARLKLGTGDCDLLSDLHSQVFPKLRIRGAKGFTCLISATRLRRSLQLEALVRTQPPPRAREGEAVRVAANSAGR